MNRWLINLLLSSLIAVPCAQASMGLPQIRYALYKDPRAPVADDLQALAQQGNLTATLMLADWLAASPDPKDHDTAHDLYKTAFAEGTGEIAALNGLAKLVNRKEKDRLDHQAYFATALTQYAHDRNFDSVHSTLESFLIYPDQVAPGDVELLIRLYQQACTEHCHPHLYQARLEERRGQTAEAEASYQQAVVEDSRSVVFYFNFLGKTAPDQQSERFKAFASAQKANAAQFSAETLHAFGNTLVSLAETHDPDVIFWLDHAIQAGSTIARVTRINYMLSMETEFGYEETLQLIEQVKDTHPLQARALRASAHMVRSWRNLNPTLAFELLQALITEGSDDAYMRLGVLYSMGGLDESDQFKAIETYRMMAHKGYGPAFYRIGMIYESGRSICQNRPMAWAYAEVALTLGQANAAKLKARIEPAMSADERALAVQTTDTLFNEYGLSR